MFVRVKRRKDKEYSYAYLVENEWTEKGTRQVVKKYLGKVYELKNEENTNIDVLQLMKKTAYEFTREIIIIELKKKGFKQEGERLINERYELTINLNNFEFLTSKGKPFVIKTNEGFMCDSTINELLKFVKNDSKEEKNKSEFESRSRLIKSLASLFLESGLPANENYFIILADKILEERNIRKTEDKKEEEDEPEFYY